MNIFEKDSWWKSLDLTVFLSSLCIALTGWLALLSVTSGGWQLSHMALRQGVYLLLGFALMIFLSTLDYRKLRALAWPLFVAANGLLIAVMLPGVGHAANGAQRWISLGPLGTLQPSEPAKFGAVFLLAHALAAGLRSKDTFSPKLMFTISNIAS